MHHVIMLVYNYCRVLSVDWKSEKAVEHKMQQINKTKQHSYECLNHLYKK